MAGPFTTTYRGSGVFAPFTSFMNMAGTVLNNIRVWGDGYIKVTPRGIDLYINGSSAFTGIAYAVNGTKTTGLASDGSKPWVKYDRSTQTFSQETGPAPQPWGMNEVWFEKAHTPGNIVMQV